MELRWLAEESYGIGKKKNKSLLFVMNTERNSTIAENVSQFQHRFPNLQLVDAMKGIQSLVTKILRDKLVN